MPLPKTVVTVTIVLVVVGLAYTPSIYAQTSQPQVAVRVTSYPSQITLPNGPIEIDATLYYSNAQGYDLYAAVGDGENIANGWITGTVATSAGQCPPSANFPGKAACAWHITHPNGEFPCRFILTSKLTSIGTWKVIVFAGLQDSAGNLVSGATSGIVVTMQVTGNQQTSQAYMPTQTQQMPLTPQTQTDNRTLVAAAVIIGAVLIGAAALVLNRRWVIPQQEKTVKQSTDLFCIEWGAKLPAGSEFCNKCGARQTQ